MLETDRVIFVRLALFAPVFVTPRCCTRHRAESGITFPTRQNNVARNLQQTFLITVGNEARA
jgi:hypothetical protein